MHILWNNIKVNPLIFVLRCCCMNYLMIKQYLIQVLSQESLMSHSETPIRWNSLNWFLLHRHKKIITLFEKCSCIGFTLFVLSDKSPTKHLYTSRRNMIIGIFSLPILSAASSPPERSHSTLPVRLHSPRLTLRVEHEHGWPGLRLCQS